MLTSCTILFYADRHSPDHRVIQPESGLLCSCNLTCCLGIVESKWLRTVSEPSIPPRMVIPGFLWRTCASVWPLSWCGDASMTGSFSKTGTFDLNQLLLNKTGIPNNLLKNQLSLLLSWKITLAIERMKESEVKTLKVTAHF